MRTPIVFALSLAAGGMAFIACTAPNPAVDPGSEIVLTSEVQWEQLNPARGDNSPKAGTLWGDRTGPGPSGFLLKPVDGFESPPHIHSAYYHGVVIQGSIHNAESEAPKLYLPPGSFWTQPGGGEHITAARGSSMAYIEVADAFDVLPAAQARSGEVRGSAALPADIAWVDQPATSAGGSGEAAQVVQRAVLWGDLQDDQPAGSFIKLPAGFSGEIGGDVAAFRAVLIQGAAGYRGTNADRAKVRLSPGAYFSSWAASSGRHISCDSAEPCVVYVRTRGAFSIEVD